ncbi:MAG: hypothetical protein J3Q66DRAFT_399606 [Benniella sp.]|nr:MAG: hypothetical protein J3Q66DRAFT_399606 [Benniella sp.]
MTSEHTTDDHFQEFRILSTSSSAPVTDNKILAPSWLDKRAGNPIALWRDVQNEIDDAHHVRSGKRSVSFMADDDFNELHPKRIRYTPGVVHDEAAVSQGQETIVVPKTSIFTRATIQGSTPSLLSVSAKNPSQQTGHNGKVTSAVQHISSLPIADSNAINRSPTVQSVMLGIEERASPRHDGIPNVPLGRVNSSMESIPIPTADDYAKKPLGGMRTTWMQEGDLVQGQILRLLLQEIHELRKQQQIQQQMLYEHGLIQQQMLDRQVLHGNHVQALTIQNYELHEYPIPRLFIVLPKDMNYKDRFSHPLTKQFRLYFLCECGEHTQGASQGSLPNKIHLAKHEGYDLSQPNEFFKQYGSYVLAMLKFFKYGAMAAGVAVPILGHFKVVEGLEAIQKNLTAALGPLVDQTIKHIQDLQGAP